MYGEFYLLYPARLLENNQFLNQPKQEKLVLFRRIETPPFLNVSGPCAGSEPFEDGVHEVEIEEIAEAELQACPSLKELMYPGDENIHSKS